MFEIDPKKQAMETQNVSVSVSTSYSGAADLSALPEGCVAQIVSSSTTPRDACRLSLVSPTFCAAAKSDAVWEIFLPCDYQAIIARSNKATSFPLPFMNKKAIYIALCDYPLIIDDGKKCFWLDKWSGKKCYMLASRELSIIWGATPDYWEWISLPESRFKEVAELRLVWWLEIRCKISTRLLSPGTNYAAYLVYKMNNDAFGFEDPPAEVSAGISGSEIPKQTVCLDPDTEQIQQFQILPRERNDGWFEIQLGAFFCEGGEDELEMSLMEVEGGVAKAGFIVEGIEIRPEGGQ